MKNAPADFGRSKVDVLKFFAGKMAVIVVNWMPITGKVVVKMENHLYPQGCEIAPVIEASFEEVPIQNLFIVLAGEVASVPEIKAYSRLCKVNYVAAKKALVHKRNFVTKGTSHYVRELCSALDGYGVCYEIEPVV